MGPIASNPGHMHTPAAADSDVAPIWADPDVDDTGGPGAGAGFPGRKRGSDVLSCPHQSSSFVPLRRLCFAAETLTRIQYLLIYSYSTVDSVRLIRLALLYSIYCTTVRVVPGPGTVIQCKFYTVRRQNKRNKIGADDESTVADALTRSPPSERPLPLSLPLCLSFQFLPAPRNGLP